MLIGIDPLLTGDILRALDQMGHGDVLVVADANFPARRVGGQVIDLSGVSAPRVVKAVSTVFPFDLHESLMLMLAPSGLNAVQSELVAACGLVKPQIDEVERFAFYATAATASLILLTGETRPYGNILLRKGVVN
jgi:L-fucose mutarotase